MVNGPFFMHDSPSTQSGIKIVFLILLLGTVLVGCTSQPPQIAVEGQYANLSGMFLGAGSVFMKIKNAGGKDALISASADVPNATVELHDVKDNRMVKTERIPIPSRDTVELKPRSLHIMLFNMPKSVQAGSEIVLLLTFERSGQVRVPVRFEMPREVSTHGGH